ncbi:hypothetical protein PF005_g20272 [Phytophthora fragariae]|uniref:Uncharacterized protein n=2 Tax=Phytophthora TaxID=4783 RepID=A0A6A3E8T0_9STRA|nr:hypothetical protein PF003_g36906 [Phytophthora fragariae]KAE9280723.1 hypothetical protein PR003_g27880 [Phytophthora rubi]KAE8928873.1 hypothetical protein PF009_g20995 [Phytophthora fragariae]KAE8982889.1 hypothetical protein PF011_g21423 [Phytophthora fragariae]KAE9080893.1 hypothetical protein PF010_g22216 [Phytophthora fragariae]
MIPSDEQLASLEELFEFIDCCVSPDVFSDSEDISVDVPCSEPITSSSIENKNPTQGSPTAVDQVAPSTNTTAPLAKPKRKRTRTGWSSSTGLQRRKRAELQFLREHVRDLETYAEKLKQRTSLAHVVGNKSCDWQGVAVAEFKERQKAEELNRALRRIMDNQLQVSAALKLAAEQQTLQ